MFKVYKFRRLFAEIKQLAKILCFTQITFSYLFTKVLAGVTWEQLPVNQLSKRFATLRPWNGFLWERRNSATNSHGSEQKIIGNEYKVSFAINQLAKFFDLVDGELNSTKNWLNFRWLTLRCQGIAGAHHRCVTWVWTLTRLQIQFIFQWIVIGLDLEIRLGPGN